VNQLLDIAELETFVIAEGEIADLAAIATEVAAYIAPLALSQHKTVAVTGARHFVPVHGNDDTLGRAVRNLVENALIHTAPGTTVEIFVAAVGNCVSWIVAPVFRAPSASKSSSGFGAATVASVQGSAWQSSSVSPRCTGLPLVCVIDQAAAPSLRSGSPMQSRRPRPPNTSSKPRSDRPASRLPADA